MNLVSKFLSTCCVAASLSSTAVFSADMLIDTTINDAIGDSAGGDSRFEVQKMDVKWNSNNIITVDIFTDFGSYNNLVNQSNHAIIFGDLFIGTDGNTNNPDYAFSLGQLIPSNLNDMDYYYNLETAENAGLARYYSFNNENNHYGHFTGSYTNNTDGGLYEINNTISTMDYHGSNNISGGNGPVFGDLGNQAAGGSWSVVSNSNTWDVLSFSFDVSGISAFENASQLSLSWAMSCYNDVVGDTLAVNRGPGTTPVSEPQTLALLALSLIGLVTRRKLKAK